MRKGNVSVVGALTLLGFLAFSGQAEAQAKSFENYMAWWNSLSCDEMVNVAIDTGADDDATQDGGAKSTLGEFRWCGTWDDLGGGDQTLIKNAVTTGPMKITKATSAGLATVPGWWASLDGHQQCIAVGRTAPGSASATDGTPCGSGASTTGLNSLMGGVRDTAMAAGYALMGEGVPAVPLVGLGVLGLVLAGRGAYLRRRRA